MSFVSVIRDIAFESDVRAAYVSNAKSFVESCTTLTDFEKNLLLEANSSKIEAYLAGPSVFGEAVETLETVAASIIVIMLGIVPHDPEGEDMEDLFASDWNHVAQIAKQNVGQKAGLRP